MASESVTLIAVAPQSSACVSCRDHSADASGATFACDDQTASSPVLQGTEAVLVLIECQCGRCRRCIDGKWRRVIWDNGDRLIGIGKLRRCLVCGQSLEVTPRG